MCTDTYFIHISKESRYDTWDDCEVFKNTKTQNHASFIKGERSSLDLGAISDLDDSKSSSSRPSKGSSAQAAHEDGLTLDPSRNEGFRGERVRFCTRTKGLGAGAAGSEISVCISSSLLCDCLCLDSSCV